VLPDDVVFELPGQGIDKVRTGLASYTLPDNVENLETYGDIGIGNALDNVIRKQDAGYAELYGLEGNDTLYHNWPGDGLVDGGAGDDTAVFGGNLADWSILDRGDKVFLTSGATHVRAIGIEHLTFNDGTIDFADGNGLFDTIFYMRGNLDGSMPARTRSTTTTRSVGTRGAIPTASSPRSAILASIPTSRRAA